MIPDYAARAAHPCPSCRDGGEYQRWRRARKIMGLPTCSGRPRVEAAKGKPNHLHLTTAQMLGMLDTIEPQEVRVWTACVVMWDTPHRKWGPAFDRAAAAFRPDMATEANRLAVIKELQRFGYSEEAAKRRMTV